MAARRWTGRFFRRPKAQHLFASLLDPPSAVDRVSNIHGQSRITRRRADDTREFVSHG